MAPKYSFVIGEAEAGERLDTALASLAGISRSQARRWIEEGRVQLGEKARRASHHVHLGDQLTATEPELVVSSVEPESIPLDILYEDDDLIVVDKPAGLVVHPAPGHPSGTLVNALLHHCQRLAGIGGVERPGIVHRLDRGTSGVIVVAKNDDAHQQLSEQFHDHTIERTYHAVVRGVPRADAGSVDRPIGRHPKDRKRMSVRGRAMRDARTRWRVCERFPKSQRAALDVYPETGRTHQIRVHLASVGLPIVGDPTYGHKRGAPELGRPALHAATLVFTHPRSGERMNFDAALPSDLADLLASLHRREGSDR